jgi:hypothetical protein
MAFLTLLLSAFLGFQSPASPGAGGAVTPVAPASTVGGGPMAVAPASTVGGGPMAVAPASTVGVGPM